MVSVRPVSKHNWFFAIFFLAALPILSQEDCPFFVEGRILDLESKEPIPFVSVGVNGGSRGAFTDANGHFKITNICKEEFDLTVSHIGYKTTVHHHDAYHQAPTILLATADQLLESIVVEGEYNPTSMSTIKVDQLSAKDFGMARSGTFGDLAGSVAGLSTISTGQNIVKPIIHGLHSNRVLIINNGVRHEFQNWGAEHAPEIDPSLAGSLDVVKGAATVRYGPDALGGVILIDPPKLELSSGFKGSMETTGQSNGRSGEGVLALSHGWKNLVLAAQGSAVRQGDLHAPGYQLTNTGKQESSASGAFRYHSNRFDLEGYYSFFYQNLGILRASVNGNLEDMEQAMQSPVPPYTRSFSYKINTPRQEVSHHLMKLRGSYVLDDQDFSFQYAYQLNHRREFDVRRGTNNEIPSINLELASQSFDFDWNHPNLGPLEGSLGFQWLYQDNDNIPGTNTVPFVPNYNNTRVGIFAIERLEHQKTTYELGMRYDFQYSSIRGRAPNNDLYENSLTFSQVTGSVGLKRSPSEALSFRSNLGMAWRPPNVSELYSFGKHQASVEYGLWRYTLDETGNVVVDGVLDDDSRPVAPEVGLKWLSSLEGHTNDTRWELTAYANLIENYIYTRPAGITTTVRGAFPYFVYDQDDALLLGVDAAWEGHFSKDFTLGVQGSYVYARDISNGGFFTEIPPARIDVGLAYAKRPDVLSESVLRLSPSYVFRYFQQPKTTTTRQIIKAKEENRNIFEDGENFDFMDAPPGFLVTNLSWSAAKGAFSWTFQVKNLFDTRYRTNTDRLRYFADQTGRNFQLSVRYTIR